MFIVTFIKDNFACFADLFKFYSYTIYKTRILRLRPASTLRMLNLAIGL